MAISPVERCPALVVDVLRCAGAASSVSRFLLRRQINYVQFHLNQRDTVRTRAASSRQEWVSANRLDSSGRRYAKQHCRAVRLRPGGRDAWGGVSKFPMGTIAAEMQYT